MAMEDGHHGPVKANVFRLLQPGRDYRARAEVLRFRHDAWPTAIATSYHCPWPVDGGILAGASFARTDCRRPIPMAFRSMPFGWVGMLSAGIISDPPRLRRNGTTKHVSITKLGSEITGLGPHDFISRGYREVCFVDSQITPDS